MKETARKDLENYLRDHYAGGVSALELLEHLVKEHAHDSLGGFFRQLQADIAADHEQLLNLMEALQFEQSRMRNAGAWAAEKFAQAKVGFTSGEDSPLRLFQSLEVLLLGVTGKELLWRALEAAKEASPVLARTDFQQLIVRAHEQAERIETERLKAARTTLFGKSAL
jgi:hypothetical protein